MRARVPQNRIYVSTYERMRADSEGEVARLAAFLGLETPRSLCHDIAEACSFERLKEASQKTKIERTGPSFWKPGAQGIFRKGRLQTLNGNAGNFGIPGNRETPLASKKVEGKTLLLNDLAEKV
jgi:hypothetical protein